MILYTLYRLAKEDAKDYTYLHWVTPLPEAPTINLDNNFVEELKVWEDLITESNFK